jgi:transcription elongation factor GreB
MASEEHDEGDDDGAKPKAPNYITPAGRQRLVDELASLGEERARVVLEVQAAAAQGDRSENAEYLYGKRRLRQIDGRMRFLRKRLEIAVVVDPSIDRGDRVFFGATVTVEDEDGVESTYQLVGEDEVDARGGKLSWRAPLGRALLGKREGDEVRVQTPRGPRAVTIVRVVYRAG